uniref:Fibronectin type-III domain-containing protein n=1 Tax=Oreochromis niloticus TaxID=8128 RepID=A0A669BAD3_ORENI
MSGFRGVNSSVLFSLCKKFDWGQCTVAAVGDDVRRRRWKEDLWVKMGTFLLLLFFAPVSGVFEGTCPRKDPPPGVLVLSPGSKLFLTCGGHVRVDGSSNGTPATPNDIQNSGVSVKSDDSSLQNVSEGYSPHFTEAGGNRSLIYSDAGYTTSPHIVQPTRATRSLKDESHWTTGEIDVEDDYEEDEEDEVGEGVNRVTRGIKVMPEWKWNMMTVGTEDRDWGEIKFGRSGTTLTLASVRLEDSGKYSCHHQGKDKFSVKVIVADSPEPPSVFCYKKSPSSKIRCEGTPQKATIKQPSCYLLLSKNPREKFKQVSCSYSFRLSRCWCALDHIEDDRRTPHLVYMCVTSITGNVTSPLMYFTPLKLLKPDPPSNVTVRQEKGKKKRLTVSWNLPTSWKVQDNFYKLIYEVKYNPVKPSIGNEQILPVNGQRQATITDIMPGVEYLIQVRTKEEFDGKWSEWSPSIYAKSWTEKPQPPSITSAILEEGQDMMMVSWNLPTKLEEQHNFRLIYEIKYGETNLSFHGENQFEGECSYNIVVTPTPDVDFLIQLRYKAEHDGQWSEWSKPYPVNLPTGSGDQELPCDAPTKPPEDKWPHHLLWIFGLFSILAVILAIYTFGHKDRFISKLHSLYFTTLCDDSSQPSPSVPVAPEGVALVTFTKSNKEHPPSNEKESEENEEQKPLRERTDAMHFNNTSYFFLQRE